MILQDNEKYDILALTKNIIEINKLPNLQKMNCYFWKYEESLIIFLIFYEQSQNKPGTFGCDASQLFVCTFIFF